MGKKIFIYILNSEYTVTINGVYLDKHRAKKEMIEDIHEIADLIEGSVGDILPAEDPSEAYDTYDYGEKCMR